MIDGLNYATSRACLPSWAGGFGGNCLGFGGKRSARVPMIGTLFEEESKHEEVREDINM